MGWVRGKVSQLRRWRWMEGKEELDEHKKCDFLRVKEVSGRHWKSSILLS